MTQLVYIRPPDDESAICTLCVVDGDRQQYLQISPRHLWNLINDAMSYMDGHIRRLDNERD